MADLAKIILKFEKDILKDMPEFSTIATAKEFPIFWAENLSMHGVTRDQIEVWHDPLNGKVPLIHVALVEIRYITP